MLSNGIHGGCHTVNEDTHMNKTRVRTGLGLTAAAGVVLLATGCGVSSTSSAPAASDEPLSNLTMLIPNTAGGGYDLTGRALIDVMEELELVDGAEVTNLPGAGGTVGLARTIEESGNAEFLVTMGLGVVGAAYTNDTQAKISDTTPIARLIEEAGAIFVPANSPYETIDDLVEAWKADPNLAVGGGSSAGGPDHLLPMQLADAVGIDPTTVNYISYDGGGELLPAILDGQIAFAVSGYAEFLEQIEAGTLRALATTGEERNEVVDAPTLVESGIDLVFTNWRGLLAPPDLTDEQVTRLQDAVTEAVESPEWQERLELNGWTDAFITGDEFETFLTEQDETVSQLLTDLGLA